MKRTSIFLLLLFLLAACGPTAGAPTTGPQVVDTLPPTPQPTPAATLPPPTAKPGPTTEPTVSPGRIVLDLPEAGSKVSSPVHVRGSVQLIPFENTLLGRVYDAQGNVIGEGPIQVTGDIPGPGTFSGEIPFQPDATGPARVEVADISPKDGSVEASAAVDVVLEAIGIGGTIEIPAPDARATLPLHIVAWVGRPTDEVTATLRWEDGSELSRTYFLLDGGRDRGLLVESLWWDADVPPLPFPPTQRCTLEIRGAQGTVLARQELTVVSWDDPDALLVSPYFLLGEEFVPVQVYVPKTVRIGTAALEQLLWGPPVYNLAGFATAIPQTREVLNYPGRTPDWGPRVRLLGLTIENGVATANFSKELKAYGGGSARVLAIRGQITRTLLEFPTVKEVVIAIEGETEGVLEP